MYLWQVDFDTFSKSIFSIGALQKKNAVILKMWLNSMRFVFEYVHPNCKKIRRGIAYPLKCR